MMADLRLRIRLAGPLATPPYSPTLFGHFCWTLRLRRGEELSANGSADWNRIP
jgi:hypothetical protein